MYTNGANAKVIADRLDTNYENIRKYIQRNLKHLKEKHLKEKERNNIILKTTLFESQREISNNSFRQYNNSIYRANKTGYTINKKVAPIISFDTPKRIKSNPF